MLHAVERGHGFNKQLRRADRSGWASDNVIFDTFEPNEAQATARPMALNTSEYLTFHWQYFRSNPFGADQYQACDVDWISFNLVSPSVMVIKTTAVSGRPQPNTRLTVFNATGAQVAQNDNANGSTVFSLITTGSLAAGQYFVRVENLSAYPSAESRGHYNLGIYQCFDQENVSVTATQNCPTATVRVNNPPAGASYNWVLSAGLVVSSGQGTSQIVVSSSSGSNVSGTAQVTVTVAGCSLALPAVDVNAGGGGAGGSINVTIQTQPGSTCGYAYHTATAQQLAGIAPSEYLWYEDVAGNPGAFLGSGLALTLQLTPANCSSVRYYMLVIRCSIRYRGYAFNPNCNCSQRLAVYPNPTSDDLTVEVVDEAESTNETQEKAKSDQDATVSLYVQMGHKVKEEKIKAKEKKVTFSVRDMKTGLYILEFKQGDVVIRRLIEVRR
jgi:hypothetical protein